MTNNWEQCENEFRKGGGRFSSTRCDRRATRTMWRMTDDGMQTKETCGTCANRMTTGRDREPTNPWRRKAGE